MSKLLRKPEAAERLRVSAATLNRYIGGHSLPVIHLSPRAVRIDEGALERFIASRSSAPFEQGAVE